MRVIDRRWSDNRVPPQKKKKIITNFHKNKKTLGFVIYPDITVTLCLALLLGLHTGGVFMV